MTRQEFLEALQRIFGHRPWPKPLHLLRGVQLAADGAPISEAARAVGTTPTALQRVCDTSDPVFETLGIRLRDITSEGRQRAALILGQLLLGRCAELAFEEIYRSEMRDEEFELRDVRESRTDTDYRLHNSRGLPVYRVNIKFHGAQFRRARDLVDLEPEDSFALATYKIYSALQKQHDEGLPYFFAVVGVPELSGELVGQQIASHLVDTVAAVHQAPRGRSKRHVEDCVVEYLTEQHHSVFEGTLQQILAAEWYILSARRADKLLRELLFERVFALRIRNFARAFRGAELDMHFSLSQDLIPLRRFLAILREEGPHKLTTLLERGEF